MEVLRAGLEEREGGWTSLQGKDQQLAKLSQQVRQSPNHGMLPPAYVLACVRGCGSGSEEVSISLVASLVPAVGSPDGGAGQGEEQVSGG